MRKTSLRIAPAFFGVVASVVALATGPALGAQINKCTRITKPGSYVLTRNLTATRDCLVVAANFVTIDLGGWVITGKDESTGSGVTDQGVPRRGIAVRNGTVTGFASCVHLSATSEAVVEKVRADCAQAGITIGSSSIVSGNQADGGAFEGISAGAFSIVSGNVARAFSNVAISAGGVSIVSDNITDGDFGISAGPGSTVSGNQATVTDGGLSVGRGSTVSGNTIDSENFVVDTTVACPSNVIGNTVTGNLVLDGEGCTNINNLVISPLN
jgi:hypothetical protein